MDGNGPAQNRTDSMALLFPVSNCRGRYTPVNRGQEKTARFASAMFMH